MDNTISITTYYQAIGLLSVAQKTLGELEFIQRALADTLGEKDMHGHCGDAVYSGYDIDTLMGNLGLIVASTEKEK